MRIARVYSGWLLGIFLGLVVACDEGLSVGGHVSEQDQQPLNERMGLSAAASTKLDVGEDCSAFEGNDACSSGLCLRVAPGFPPKGFCSVSCTPDPSDDGCPDGPQGKWGCTQLWPTEQGWFCMPGKGWTADKATHKGGPVTGRKAPGPHGGPVLDAGFP